MRAQRDAIRAQSYQIRAQMRGMRRGSVLGPLLLIAIGVVFLLVETSRLNLSRFWEWYGHWWPMLLVAAGIVLLAEWTFDQVHLRDPERPPYRRSVGFGVIIMLFFLVLAGVIGHHITAGERWDNGGWHFDQENLDEFFGDKHESDQTLDLAFPAGGSVAVVDPRGDVTIDGTSDDGRIHIAEHKQVYARSDPDADSKARQLSPAVAREGTAVSINIAALDGASADLVLTVPAAAAIRVNANRGEIRLNYFQQIDISGYFSHDVGLKPVRITGISQQLFGHCWIVSVFILQVLRPFLIRPSPSFHVIGGC